MNRMARGGRGIGRGGRGGGGGPSFEDIMDNLHNTQTPPVLINGTYSFTGSEMSFRIYAEMPAQPTSLNMMQMMEMEEEMIPTPMMQIQMMPESETTGFPAVLQASPAAMMHAPVQQANITIVGNKSKSSNACCVIMTIMFFCLIFPVLFTCCEWWKKIVSPLYELTTQAYQSIADFIRVNPTITNINLTVVDNAFSAEKASILAAALGNSRITGITFVNGAIALNGNQKELDNFAANVQPIKSLNLTSSIIWGEVIV